MVEDENKEASSESSEPICEAVPLQQKMPGVHIREPDVMVQKPAVGVPSSSDRKGKRVIEDEDEVYTRNIKAHKPDVPFVNLGPADMAIHFNKAARCLLSRVDMDHLDSLDPAVRAEQAQKAMADVSTYLLYHTPTNNV